MQAEDRMPDDVFQLRAPQPQRPVAPIEPLHSMLHDAPLTAVDYLHRELSRFHSEKDLDEIVPNLGITRKKAIQQTWLVLSQRRQD